MLHPPSHTSVPIADPPSRRILVCGVGPLPPESPGRLSAPGLRVWGIARELALAGHVVRLLTIEYKGGPIDEAIVRDLSLYDSHGTFPSVTLAEPRMIALASTDGLRAIIEDQVLHDFKPDAVVGSMDMINREVASLPSHIPLWCDYFGDPMAERQMLAYHYGDDDILADQWRTYAPALLRADRVSGCSRRQAGAILGELAALGRLNRHTALDTLVHRFDPWIEPITPSPETGPFLRGTHAPDDAFILIQTGGFNTWLDIDTMFTGIEMAMKADPAIHFAATGGGLKGHNEWAYDRFRKLIADSPFKDRFHLLGWVPLGHVPRIISECDLGINIDLPSPEGWLGTRNRIMDWILGGLPVLSTLGTELVEDLAAANLLLAIPQRDVYAVSEGILRIKADCDAWRVTAERAADHLRIEQTPAKCLAPLIAWASDPRTAPDRSAWETTGATPPVLHLSGNAGDDTAILIEQAQRHLFGLNRELQTLEGSALVRFAMKLRRRGDPG